MSATVAPPPPAALFRPSEDEEKEQRRREDDDRKAEAGRARWRKMRGRWGWALAGVLGATTVAQALTISALLPLKEIQHRFTHTTSDNVVTTMRSFDDLPESKREQLILATAAKYVRWCNTWDFYRVAGQHGDYRMCDGLSADAGPGFTRQAEFRRAMHRDNAKNPERVYGREGRVDVMTLDPVRTGPRVVRVPMVRVERKKDERPVATRWMVYLDYVPVTDLPPDLRLNEPLADILFVRMSLEPDNAPIPGVQTQ